MESTIRIEDETHLQLIVLTKQKKKKSMSKMIQELLDFYKEKQNS